MLWNANSKMETNNGSQKSAKYELKTKIKSSHARDWTTHPQALSEIHAARITQTNHLLATPQTPGQQKSYRSWNTTRYSGVLLRRQKGTNPWIEVFRTYKCNKINEETKHTRVNRKCTPSTQKGHPTCISTCGPNGTGAGLEFQTDKTDLHQKVVPSEIG